MRFHWSSVVTKIHEELLKIESFDEGFEVRGVFLDTSKAFDKVWHEGLIFKLKQNGISGNLLNLLNVTSWEVENKDFYSMGKSLPDMMLT